MIAVWLVCVRTGHIEMETFCRSAMNGLVFEELKDPRVSDCGIVWEATQPARTKAIIGDGPEWCP